MKVALVWIRMYSLLCEYWDPKILEDLGNSLGKFIKISEHAKIQIYIAYTRICVYMDLTDLREAIIMSWEDEDKVQTLDYEHIPFWCRRCHEYGHLFRECPMNNPNKTLGKEEENSDQGFTRLPSRK